MLSDNGGRRWQGIETYLDRIILHLAANSPGACVERPMLASNVLRALRALPAKWREEYGETIAPEAADLEALLPELDATLAHLEVACTRLRDERDHLHEALETWSRTRLSMEHRIELVQLLAVLAAGRSTPPQEP